MSFAVVIGALILGAFGIYIGYLVGEQLSLRCVTTKQYWLANLAVLVAGVLVSAVVSLTGLVLVVVLTIGLIAGALAGLKFGFGESSGPWKVHDRAFNVNRDQLATAEGGRGQAWRERRRTGASEPELMSTITDAPGASQQESENHS